MTVRSLAAQNLIPEYLIPLKFQVLTLLRIPLRIQEGGLWTSCVYDHEGRVVEIRD